MCAAAISVCGANGWQLARDRLVDQSTGALRRARTRRAPPAAARAPPSRVHAAPPAEGANRVMIESYLIGCRC